MAEQIQARISLDRLHCADDGDGPGDAEPYLWTIFFKIDGDTVEVGPDGILRGRCRTFPTPGSHGNLGTRDVDSGEDVTIPAAIGEFVGDVKPIPVPQSLGGGNVAGHVGVVAVLMEEDFVSDNGAEAGHLKLNETFELVLNGKLQELGVAKPELNDADRKQLAELVRAVVPDAVEEAQTAWENATTILNEDDEIGFIDFTFSQDELVNTSKPFSHRFKVEAFEGEWKLLGEASGIVPDAHGYTPIARSAEYQTPSAAGVPTACAFPQLSVDDIMYMDSDGRLHELWRDAAGQTGTSNLTALAGAPAGSGNPYVYLDTNAVLAILLYRGRDSHVHALYWSTGGVGHDNLSAAAHAPQAAGSPVGFFTPATNTHHVVYRKSNNHLHVLWWAGGDVPGHDDATTLASAVASAGDPSAFLDTLRGENIIVYRGVDGHIRDIYWTGGDPLGHEDVSGFCGAPNAASDPVGGYSAPHDARGIVYRDVDDHLIEIYSAGNGPAAWWDLTAVAGAPPASGKPAVYNSVSTNTRHVIFRSADGHLNELWWTPGGGAPAHVDLTLRALAPLAAVSPTAFTVEGPNTQHVAYRGVDNGIHEIRWR